MRDSKRETPHHHPERNLARLRTVYLPLFVLSIVAMLLLILRWAALDLENGFMAGAPAPRTYFALYDMFYDDQDETQRLRDMAQDSVVGVLTRQTRRLREVKERLQLVASGRLQEAGVSPALAELLGTISEDRRMVVLREISSAGTALLLEDGYRNSPMGVTDDILWRSLAKADLSAGEGNLAVQTLSEVLIPLVAEDGEITDKLRNMVAEAVQSVSQEVHGGDVIVTKGQLITDQIARLLEKQGYPRASFPYRFMLLLLLTVPLAFFWVRWVVVLPWDPSRMGYVVFLFSMGLCAAGLSGLYKMTALAVIPLGALAYATMPLRPASGVVLSGSVIIAVVFNDSTPLSFGEILATGVAVAAVGERLFMKIDSRSRLWLSMVELGLVALMVTLATRWAFRSSFDYMFFMKTLSVSVLWGTVIMVFLPLTEALFDTLSPLRLLELCQPDHPLQKRLQIEAPGTYHHSQMVATLAEAGADALGINSRLAKAGAFFHDIGKLKRPQFFVENQFGAKNAHDGLSPVMSTLVIISHVREGLDLAAEYRLPEGIRRFISEHHGTTFLGYFYKKALRMGLDPSSSQFHYPGPRPASAETGVVMLADSVEAAVRAERENLRNFSDLQEIVDGVVASKLKAGQLDDTGLTFADLSLVKSAMIQTLKSMYHTRNIAPLPQTTALAGKDGPT